MIVNLSKGVNTVEFKWIYKMEDKENGEVVKFRLITKRYIKIEGYTISHVAKIVIVSCIKVRIYIK